MRRDLDWVALVWALALIAVGTGLLLAGPVRERTGESEAASVAEAYGTAVSESEDGPGRMLDEAREYNRRLAEHGDRFGSYTADTGWNGYGRLLDPAGDGVMCILEIPSLGVKLPVYHGTGEDVLQKGLGHMCGSSLPVGGAGTHCVISGHSGIPHAELFNDLDKVGIGDRFAITVLDAVLTYEVDQVKTVLPDDLSDLGIDPDGDYCTLVTCVPYGINSHRLLVRGTRVDG